MTAALAPTFLEPALLAAAEAAAAALPNDAGWTVEPVPSGDAGSPGDVAEALARLGKNPQAVSLGFGGVGRLVLCVTAGYARSVQVGPPPAEDLLDGVSPALRAAAGALVAAFGADASAPVEVPIGGALQTRAGEQLITAVLLDGGTPTALLALACPVPETDATPNGVGPDIAEHNFAALGDSPANPFAGLRGPIDLLADVEMGVTAELGRTRMLVRDILALSPGSVIELDRAAGSPIDVLVNGTLIARGEVVVIDEEFGIRITEVLGYEADRNAPPSRG